MARRILGIAGSLRGGSYNKAVLRTLAEQSWEGVEIEIFDISAIPLYNSDQDGEHERGPQWAPGNLALRDVAVSGRAARR